MTVFLGVYKAIYDYEPQTPEELEIKENDMLYLLEKSDIDEWWTVKKRIIGSDDPEPSGLVPSTYIEDAPVIRTVKAVYDYDQPQNPDEELLFHENDTFQVYDDKDPDWLLVKSSNNEFGFIPGNYIEEAGATGGAPAAAAATPVPVAVATSVVTPANADVSTFLPPPQHNQRDQLQSAEQSNNEPATPDRYAQEDDREDTPPSKPMRPNDARDKARSRVSYYDEVDDNNIPTDNGRDNRRDEPHRYADEDDYGSNTNNYNNDRDNNDNRGSFNIEYHSWNVQEIEGRKKRKAKLVVGSNKINFISENGTQLEWTVDKLVSYDNEKKHMFLEFVDPYKNLELHTGNNETSKEIMSILGEIKGVSRDKGLKEIETASQTKRKGKIAYDFIGESNDELTVKQGDLVYIINDKKSKEWWMCESVDTGRRGVIPAQFVEPIKDKSSSSAGGLFNSIKKMAKGNRSPSKSHSNSVSGSGSWRDDVTPDESASSKSRSRGASFSSRKKRSASMSKPSDNVNKKKFPDPKKSRLWVDRSGTFKVDAQFIGCANGKIHLHKANGVKIAVAANKLSDSDLVYVENITGFSLDKYKINSSGSSGSGNKDARESERDRRRRLREQEEKERDRRIRERELNELKKARQLLDDERLRLEEQKDLPPVKPPRPNSTVGMPSSSSHKSSKSKNNYDWFEFFLNSGVDVSNCQRYTINFDREQITEDMMEDINAQMLRTLGLREGDIVRVMKFLDNKFGRDTHEVVVPAQTGGMFTEADGSLKNNNNNVQQGVSQQLLPQTDTAAMAAPVSQDDDAWTARPAAKSQPDLVSGNSNFTGSMQDLLDLQPLEPKKHIPSQVPEPNLNNLEPVKTGNAIPAVAPITTATTGGANLVPLDPFKTGGNNILPIGTGFVMMPIATGGMMSTQRTGGLGMPVTTFGTQLTGGVLPVQKTNGGLIPIATTGGLMPQTTFGAQLTGGLMPLQTTGGLMPLQRTGGIIPQTTFGTAAPMGSVLPVQRTANGLMPLQTTGGIMPSTTFMNPVLTGGAMPQTSFVNPALAGGMNPMMNQTLTGGMNPMMNQALTGGMNPMMNQALTGGMNPMMNQALTGGAMPQTSFGAQMTGGAMPQTGFGNQTTGGAMMPQTSFGAPMQHANTMPMQITGGFQPQSQFGVTLQRTGGAMPINTGVNNITQGMQNTTISQPQQLQTQPTGFGFGNGPQQTQQGRQANIFNASAANPFGF
ncbi:similar to Saccharomyces cerevisiae YBL007C SLA1 Cytoskeletal protein binding protein required for assembly of the cortical actin cytoskeleton [Maudiozyma barnettii]|uniref:Actin cytoskeleton-regulatory complex protein SLA1 n=1 Tax=Maudiozyma barnettii TaxID=61262 RepID=A0A8H2ZIL6_9SACH|nr:cytoskeletal protein-binding protein SLA1 [Kazachstania barnettii]CAB4255093.1 similar to Saccharomyces cerevisiae YBL007C SLA1 Cytoskeletal protein binding protein required for assembly of the cortical actin cytoskeleton [Kazachstania barnettii]CAD1783364.1 similar to Saccharomyces cerevisiae YBL007C SLA1 Cytoskeletal protein binding protein required for assembly of the cortical actin cytoskeleton [Kazachstania barnettii]